MVQMDTSVSIDGGSDVDVDADPLDDSLELDGQVDSAITALRLQSTAKCARRHVGIT